MCSLTWVLGSFGSSPSNYIFFSSVLDLRCFEMEKEKEDSSSPRGVLEACIRDLDTRASSPKTNISKPKVCPSNSHALSRWRGFFKLWKKSSIKRLSSFPPFAVPKISRRKSRSMRENVDGDFCYFKSAWKNFTFSDLQSATNNFSQGLWVCSTDLNLKSRTIVLPKSFESYRKYGRVLVASIAYSLVCSSNLILLIKEEQLLVWLSFWGCVYFTIPKLPL